MRHKFGQNLTALSRDSWQRDMEAMCTRSHMVLEILQKHMAG